MWPSYGDNGRQMRHSSDRKNGVLATFAIISFVFMGIALTLWIRAKSHATFVHLRAIEARGFFDQYYMEHGRFPEDIAEVIDMKDPVMANWKKDANDLNMDAHLVFHDAKPYIRITWGKFHENVAEYELHGHR
jgi:hypothetical protein